MNLFNKLPGHKRSPPGLERRLLRELPRAIAASTLVPLFCFAIAWLYPSPDPGQSAEKYLFDVGILAASVIVTAWTAALTIAIGCFVVVVMKGPAYVADAYPLHDSEEPASPDSPRAPTGRASAAYPRDE